MSRDTSVAVTLFWLSLLIEVNALSLSMSQGGRLQTIKVKYSACLSQHFPTFLRYVTRRRNKTTEHFHWLASPYVGVGVCVLYSNYRLQHLLDIAYPISLELFPFSVGGSLSGTFHQKLTCIFPGEQMGTWPNLGQLCTASRILNCVKGDSKSENSWN